jgi:hypothetical protein
MHRFTGLGPRCRCSTAHRREAVDDESSPVRADCRRPPWKALPQGYPKTGSNDDDCTSRRSPASIISGMTRSLNSAKPSTQSTQPTAIPDMPSLCKTRSWSTTCSGVPISGLAPQADDQAACQGLLHVRWQAATATADHLIRGVGSGFKIAHFVNPPLARYPGLLAAPIKNPPSTTMVWPVTYDERSDSSHSATSAISEAVPKRPIAILRTTAE